MRVLFTATVIDHIKAFHIPYIKWLSKNNYKVDIACKDAEKLTNINNAYDISITRSPYSLKNFKGFFELKKIIDHNNYDIIHCHTPMGGVLTRLAAVNARKHNTKVLYTAHGFHFFKGSPLKNWILYYPIEKMLANITDVLITINEEDYKLANKNFNANEVKYINGIGLNVDYFKNTKVDKHRKLKELEIPENRKIILSIGELNKNKNHEVVIEALSKVDKNNYYYLICGKGKQKKHLLNLISKLNLDNKIKLLGYRNDINEILKISDIYIHPSFREGLPVSVMEAMASGLPVIASKIRGSRDLIDKKGGLLINPQKTENVYRKIVNLLKKDKSILKEMGLYNYNKIQKHDIKIILEKMAKIYKNNS